MVEPEDRWPFGTTDGGPATRPLSVDLEGVLIAMLADAGAGEQAKASLGRLGLGEDRLRLYSGEQIVEYDEAFRADRGLAGLIVGAFVDDRDAMAQYVAYGREGCSAVWALVPERYEADRVVKCLADHSVRHIWYYTANGVETLHMG